MGSTVSSSPSGSKKTLPFNCSIDPGRGTIAAPGLGGSLTEYFDHGGWNQTISFPKSCIEANRDTGDKLSTAFTARDMLEIVDGLDGQDGTLNYLGFSYGTILGTTFAAMFPDRVGRMVLDGVADPSDWVGKRLTMSDGLMPAFDRFLALCAANPGRCLLASLVPGEEPSYELLRAVVMRKLAGLEDPPATHAANLVASRIKMQIITSLYSRAGWVELGTNLYHLLSTSTITLRAPPEAFDHSQGLIAIACADTLWREASFESLRQTVQQEQRRSWFSNIYFPNVGWYCAAWPFRSKEVFTGPFTGNSSILFVGSPYDHVTPLSAARTAGAGFPNSIVLQHNGVGHTSQSNPSKCTDAYVRDYFLTGRLPLPNTTCEPEEGPFDRAPLLQLMTSAAADGAVRDAVHMALWGILLVGVCFALL